ncbi:hypothetical protein UlMin_024264 [Ulmus minor]
MMMMVIVMVMMVVLMGILLINDFLNGPKLLHEARNSDGALLIKSILFLSFFEKLHEERMVDVDNRNHKPLLFFALSNQDCQTPLWDVLELFMIFLLVVVMEMDVRKMDMEVQMAMVGERSVCERSWNIAHDI